MHKDKSPGAEPFSLLYAAQQQHTEVSVRSSFHSFHPAEQEVRIIFEHA